MLLTCIKACENKFYKIFLPKKMVLLRIIKVLKLNVNICEEFVDILQTKIKERRWYFRKLFLLFSSTQVPY